MNKKQISREEWERRMGGAQIRKKDMNRLIMDYLVTEGHVEAARKFQQESETPPRMDLSTISERMAVRNAVQQGKVEDAIDRVNDLNPEILDMNPEVFFRLQQQRFIELVRSGNLEQALEFAQEELAPRGEENEAYLEELERTVALLAFEDGASSPLGDLLATAQRQKTASELNAAILTSQNHDMEPKLPSLLKLLISLQGQLDPHVTYPKVHDFENPRLTDPATPEPNS